MAKILYLIITYTNPEQVLRLVKAIKSGSPESQVVIHHDYTNSKYYLSASLFEQFQEVYVLKNYVPVQWGHISWVQAVLCGISWAIENYLKFDWLVLLSGQDYPIQPIQKTEKFLEDTQYDGFMEHFLAEAIQENPSQCGLQWNKNTGIVRFFYQYYHLKKSPRALKSISFHLDRLTQWQPFVRAAIVQDRLLWGVRALSSPFDNRFRCYAGSNWFTLSFSCIHYVYDYAHQYPDFIRYYQKTIIPEESFFHTILMNQTNFKILNNNQRYISWQVSHPNSPAILTSQHFKQLITSNKHFGRKFDVEKDRKILDLLEREILLS